METSLARMLLAMSLENVTLFELAHFDGAGLILSC